jgi:eukaryotic-like serine/threonine-protein kinase
VSAPVAADDPRVIAALDEYVAALEAGRRPDRAAFLAARADVAEPLAACLDGLDWVHHAAAGLDPPAADADLAAAAPLGDFRLLRMIGRGGMGVVYEAEQLSLGRRVALKVLPFAAALDPKQLQRFQHEAQAAAHLQHPHIVPVHAVGCERGVHFYAMQLIEGRSLAEVIRDLCEVAGLPDPGAPPPGRAEPAAETRPADALTTDHARPDRETFRRAARLGRQAALALEHAHQVGVVHRDIKPANLLVDTHDHLWVTDFGLAQFHGRAALTATGDVPGTLRYMSPEQVAGAPAGVDHRTDVYSLGATLYELLTLIPAAAGTDRADLIRQIRDAEPVPPRRLRPQVPRDLETIVLKALAKDPPDRYPTAQALADDLGRFLDDRPVAATRPGAWRRMRKWARRHRPVVATATAAGVLLLFSAVVVLSVSMARVAREERRKDEALAEAQAHLAAEERQRARAERNSDQAFAAVHEMLTRVALDQATRFPEMDRTRRELLERALQFYQRFVQPDDPDPAARYETARALAAMTLIQGALGRPAEAERLGREAQARFEGLARDFPVDRRYRAGLVDLHTWLGTYHRSALGRPREAENHFREAVRLSEPLAVEDAAGHRVRQADACCGLAYQLTRERSGGREEAEGFYRRAIDLLEAERAAGREDVSRLAFAYNSFGLLRRQAKAPADAEALHRRALDLAARSGASVGRGELARGHFHLALAVWAQGRRDEAIPHAAEAVALRQADADDFPLAAGPLAELVATCRGLAWMLDRADRRDEAAATYDRAVRLAGRLVARFRDHPDAEQEWVRTLAAAVRFTAAIDRPAAESAFRRLWEFDPTHAGAQNDLAWMLVTFPDPCLGDPVRAVELAGKAVAAAPENGTYWNTLGVARYRAGDWTGAITALEESRRLLANGQDSFNTFFLALAHWRLGDSDSARRRYAEAVHWMDRYEPNDAELVRFRQEAEAAMGGR